MVNPIYGDIMSVKERISHMAVQSDTLDVDLEQKLNDASDFVIMRLEEHPLVFPTPSALTGTKKTRVDRIVNDLAAAFIAEDRSMKIRTVATATSFEDRALIWRKRAMMELEQFIKVEIQAANLGEFPADIKKIQGKKLGER